MLISALWIAAKAAVFVAALGFAGGAALRLVFGRQLAPRIEPWSALAAGAVLFHCTLMLVRQVGAALAVLAVLAAVGAWLAIRERAAPEGEVKMAWWETLIMVLLGVLSIADPLTDWDARSIWFYHAKIVFYDGLDGATWNYVLREAAFSHPYYPKLVPALGGAAAWLFGFWNDYLPKIAVAVVLLPALALGGRLFADWRMRALFWVIVLATVKRYLWTGWMDGLLAVWSAVALLYVVAAFLGAVSRERALVVVPLALASCIGLKAEGWVIALCFIVGVLAITLLTGRAKPLRAVRFGDYARALAFIAAPYLLWRLYCAQAGVGEGWGTLNAAYLGRAAERLGSGELAAIAQAMFRRSVLLWLLAMIAALAVLARTYPAWRPALAAGASILFLYWGALFFVYLGTPHDLPMQLRTSVSRTMLTPRLWVLALLLAGFAAWIGAWRTRGRGA
jgi:hypothetical protein